MTATKVMHSGFRRHDHCFRGTEASLPNWCTHIIIPILKQNKLGVIVFVQSFQTHRRLYVED